MYIAKKIQFVFLIIVFSTNTFAQGEIKNHSQINRLDSILDDLQKDYSIQNFNSAFDLAKQMSLNDKDSIQLKKGVNTIAFLAQKFKKQVASKSIDLNDAKYNMLLSRFEKERYFIQQPKVSPIIKTMNYFCKGEFLYVHEKLIDNRYYKIFLLSIAISMMLFIASFCKTFKWRFKKQFIRLMIFAFIFFSITFLAFKFSCKECIDDYSFYGFRI